MAFTGDLEQLNIVDVIQLIHTTRKSGTFSVQGPKGVSRIIFSNGYLVGASHLNNRIRIGTVLVRTNAIAREDLAQALDLQQKAGKERQPLINTLIGMGKLTQETAFRGLKKLIEITLIELIAWNKGVFTFDVDAITVSDQCSYLPGKMDQVMSLDAQMVLMDALRVLDERERDRAAGGNVPSYEEEFAEVLPQGAPEEAPVSPSVITADILGLEDLDHLERKIPQSFSLKKLFDPLEIHRQKTRELLQGFSPDEQDSLIAFLEKSSVREGGRGIVPQERQAKAFILFSRDQLLTHAVMTMCKDDDALVFTADQEEELEHIVEQCQVKKIVPLLVFDAPATTEDGLTEDKIVSLRLLLKDRYPRVPMVQLAPPREYSFMLESYCDGISAVFPKPLPEIRRETFITDLIRFLEAFQCFLHVHSQQVLAAAEQHLDSLRGRMLPLREIRTPAEVTLSLLQAVAEFFERAVTMSVRPGELQGERAIGIFGERNQGSVPATKLKVPVNGRSVFREVIDGGRFFYGERDDTIMATVLWKEIGAPLRPVFLVLPVTSNGEVVSVTYADFGRKEVSLPQLSTLEMLANHAGLVIEHEGCGTKARTGA